MASGVNKVILIGHLGSDPEVRFTPSGMAVANFSIATSETWNDKDGQRQDRTEWHRIVVWGKTAEHCGEYLGKGRQVYIEGRLQTRKWADREGAQKQTTEIVAQKVTFLGGGREGQGQGQGSGQGGGAPSYGGGGGGAPSNMSNQGGHSSQGGGHGGQSGQGGGGYGNAPQSYGNNAAPAPAQGGDPNFDFAPPPVSDDDVPF